MKYHAPTLLFLTAILFLSSCNRDPFKGEQPNILWITSEDMNAFLGCYGDTLAITPHLDSMATKGVIYTHAFATAPVCSPSRSCLITGVYASSLGTQHLRSEVRIPSSIVPFPKILRDNGYYCTNSDKEDYNFRDTTIWDDSSKEAHWRNRPDGKPFFSVFNIGTTHQSQIFGSDSTFYQKYGQYLRDTERHQANEMAVPPYHFDSPLIRKLWARYYDLVTLMDRQVGEILAQLEEDGLAESTIVFFYSDHGVGMPRSKRALYDSGLRVPLIVRAPVKWQHSLNLLSGSVKDDLIGFEDFAPTILSLCGADIPEFVQGTPFLGKDREVQHYVFGHSDRVDEAYELSRTVRDARYRYVRNYLPMLPLIQDNFYTDQSEIMQELRQLSNQGEMTSAQATMWETFRETEELYDTKSDPHEVNNLVGPYEYERLVNRFRREHQNWVLRTHDTGFMHEIDMHLIKENQTIYELARDSTKYPMERILEVLNTQLSESWFETDITQALQDSNRMIRYWAAVMLDLKEWQKDETGRLLEALLADESPAVRIAAAKALIKNNYHEQAALSLLELLQKEDKMIALYAARTIQECLESLGPIRDRIQSYRDAHCPEPNWNDYYSLYACWSLIEATADREKRPETLAY